MAAKHRMRRYRARSSRQRHRIRRRIMRRHRARNVRRVAVANSPRHKLRQRRPPLRQGIRLRRKLRQQTVEASSPRRRRVILRKTSGTANKTERGLALSESSLCDPVAPAVRFRGLAAGRAHFIERLGAKDALVRHSFPRHRGRKRILGLWRAQRPHLLLRFHQQTLVVDHRNH